MSDLTWDEVKARSLRGDVCCAFCWLSWQTNRLPCSSHATQEERREADDMFDMLADRFHPLIGGSR